MAAFSSRTFSSPHSDKYIFKYLPNHGDELFNRSDINIRRTRLLQFEILKNDQNSSEVP